MTEEKKTYESYLAEVEAATKQHPDWRYGQVAFNVLFEMRPDLSKQIRGNYLDPFYMSGKLREFHAWVERNW